MGHCSDVTAIGGGDAGHTVSEVPVVLLSYIYAVAALGGSVLSSWVRSFRLPSNYGRRGCGPLLGTAAGDLPPLAISGSAHANHLPPTC